MKIVNSDIVKELKDDALEYITYVKGKDLTKEDINTAETLIIFGYLKAKPICNIEASNKLLKKKHKKETKNIPELYFG